MFLWLFKKAMEAMAHRKDGSWWYTLSGSTWGWEALHGGYISFGGIKLDVFPLILDFIGTMWISEDQNGKLRSKCHLELTNWDSI